MVSFNPSYRARAASDPGLLGSLCVREEGPPQRGGSNETTLNHTPVRRLTAAMAHTGRMGGARTGAATFRSSAASAFRSLSVPGLLQVGELPQMMIHFKPIQILIGESTHQLDRLFEVELTKVVQTSTADDFKSVSDFLRSDRSAWVLPLRYHAGAGYEVPRSY